MLASSTNLFFYSLLIVMTCYPFCKGYPKSIEDKKTCLNECKLTPVNMLSTQKNFMNKTDNPAIILLYFNITIGKIPVYNSSNDDSLYAWSRGVIGEPLFSIPQYYMSACLYLPYLFHDSLQFEVSESEPGCIVQTSRSCRRYIIFRTLIDFTGIDECAGSKCNTICRRRFTDHGKPELYREHYSCCEPPAFHNNSIDPDDCIESITVKNFPNFNKIIVALSAIVTIVQLQYLTRCWIQFEGR